MSGLDVSSEVTPAVEWCSPPPAFPLPRTAVHVWRADLDLDVARLHQLRGNLSADEQERAARFRFSGDRERFTAARGLLRDILTCYLDTAANKVRFHYGPHGKPCLAEPAHADLRFNVSHSHAVMLIAVAHQREVGVDIEHCGAAIAVEDLAETTLSAPEEEVLRLLDRHGRRRALLQSWVRKEAYIKADGRGVSLPLTDVDVATHEGRVAVLNATTGKWETCPRWTLLPLAVGPEYAGALAVEGQGWQLACWHWLGSPGTTGTIAQPRAR